MSIWDAMRGSKSRSQHEDPEEVRARLLEDLKQCFHYNLLRLDRSLVCAVSKHSAVLTSKYAALRHVDEYGEVDQGAWQDEALRFARRFTDFDEFYEDLAGELSIILEENPFPEISAAGFLASFKRSAAFGVEVALGLESPRPESFYVPRAVLRWQWELRFRQQSGYYSLPDDAGGTS